MTTLPTPDTAREAPQTRARRRPLSPRAAVAYALLIALSLLFLFPFYLMLRNGLSSDAQITAPQFVWWPNPIHFENFAELFGNRDVPILNGLRNSAIIATVQTVVGIFLASLAGYGLARIPYRYSGAVLGFILATMTIPGIALFVPKYVLVSQLGWVNTLHGIIVPDLFSAFSAFMFRQFYLDFPKEIEEAGRLDGLSYFGLYWKLALPNSKGMLTALGVLAFIGSWNAFLWPLVIGQNTNYWTVQVNISSYLTGQTINLHQIFLGSLVAIAPLVLVFLLMQRWIVEGVKLSGTKG